MRRLLFALVCLFLLAALATPSVACELRGVTPFETPIFAGQTIDAGTAYITNDGCDIVITAFAENGWQFQEAHAYVGNDPTPLNRGGNPAPGRFPYSLDFANPVLDFEVRVPLSSLGITIGRGGRCVQETVWVALHVVVGNGGSGKKSTETGWAFGPSAFGKRWGWEIPYEVQCGRQDPPTDPPTEN